MAAYAAFTVDVPNMGTVAASFDDATTINVQASRALLHDGLLYSLSGTLGLHGSGWYPVSGVTVTGQLGKNAPKKVADPVSEAVTVAVNAYMIARPETYLRARQEIYDAKTKSLRSGVKYAQENISRYAKDAERWSADLAKHLEALP